MASERITLTVAGPGGDREVSLSSPNRVIWRELGITKHELAEYVIAVAGPFLRANGHRPVSLERYPDTVEGESFFSKNPPRGAPDYVHEVMCTYNSGRRHPQVVLDEAAAIVWAVQMNTVVFHPWASLAADTDNPVELRIDLDPQPGTDFGDGVPVNFSYRLTDALGKQRNARAGGRDGIGDELGSAATSARIEQNIAEQVRQPRAPQQAAPSFTTSLSNLRRHRHEDQHAQQNQAPAALELSPVTVPDPKPVRSPVATETRRPNAALPDFSLSARKPPAARGVALTPEQRMEKAVGRPMDESMRRHLAYAIQEHSKRELRRNALVSGNPLPKLPMSGTQRVPGRDLASSE